MPGEGRAPVALSLARTAVYRMDPVAVREWAGEAASSAPGPGAALSASIAAVLSLGERWGGRAGPADAALAAAEAAYAALEPGWSPFIRRAAGDRHHHDDRGA